MQKRNILNSPRLKEFKRKQNKIVALKISLVIFLFAALLAGLSFLSRWSELNIQSISVTGNNVVTNEEIEEVVHAELSGYYLWIFPKTNFLFYPRKGIIKKLNEKFTRLKDITPSLKDVNSLEISVSERAASYTWCGDDLPKEGFKPGSKDCYFLDETGYIFEEAPYFSNDVYFRFFGKAERKNEKILGGSFFPEIWDGLVTLRKNVADMGIKPSSLFVKEDGDVELYLLSTIPPPNAQRILFKSTSDFLKVAENLQTALNTEPLKSDFKNKYSSLLYIDLRFGNKVYFKFK